MGLTPLKGCNLLEISKKDMLTYFEELNRRLVEDNKQGEIIIAGGAALTLAFDARDSTRDIDAVFQPKDDLGKIVENMADEYGLNKDWINDGVKGFITDKMNFNEILKYSNLSVSSMDAEALLAMKLTSARVDSKDMDDSIFLMNLLDIKKESELFEIINKYTYPNRHTIASKYFTIEAFEKYQGTLNRKLSNQCTRPSFKDTLNRAKQKSKNLANKKNVPNKQKPNRETPDL